MRRTIDLNADLGEGCPHDWELLQVVTSASISCGAHAGDRESMRNALRWAKEFGVRVGAHPGFADRANFGRREQHVSELEVAEIITTQFLALKALAEDVGTPVRDSLNRARSNPRPWDTPPDRVAGVAVLRNPGPGPRDRGPSTDPSHPEMDPKSDHHESMSREAIPPILYVKPHGALYNQAQRDPRIASGVIRAVTVLNLPVLGMPGSILHEQAKSSAARFVPEGFPDRRYRPDGRLVPRTEPDAILRDPAEMAEHLARLVGVEGVETLCIHGDDPDAVANARCVRSVLDRMGIAVRSFV